MDLICKEVNTSKQIYRRQTLETPFRMLPTSKVVLIRAYAQLPTITDLLMIYVELVESPRPSSTLKLQMRFPSPVMTVEIRYRL